MQQQNAQLQEQKQAQQAEIQNLNANINAMAEGFQATQAALNQLLAHQANNPPVVPVVAIPNPPVAADVPPVMVQNVHGNHYTLEKFIKKWS